MKIEQREKAPGFTLQDTSGKSVTLSDLMKPGNGMVLLLFFPLAFSDICTDEMCTLRNNMKLYNSLNTTVAGISVDSFFTLREFKKANNLNFLLLSDFNKKAAEKYGVLNDDYYGLKGVARRSAFVVDPDRIVRYAEVLEDDTRHPDFKAIQKVLMDF